MTKTKRNTETKGSRWTIRYTDLGYEIRQDGNDPRDGAPLYRAFCSTTGEASAFWAYTIDDIEMQLEDHGYIRAEG